MHLHVVGLFHHGSGTSCVGTSGGYLQEVLLLLLTRHALNLLHTDALRLVGLSLQVCTRDVGHIGRATTTAHDVGEAGVACLERIGSGKQYLTAHLHVLLLVVARAAVYEHLVEWLEHEARFAVDDKAILQGEGVGLGEDGVRLQGAGIDDSAAHVHTYGRGLHCQSACLKDEVLQRLVVCILIYTGILHLSVYGQRPFLLHVRTCWYEENVAILQRDVGCTTRQNALHIDRDDFQGAVGLETVHDGSGGKCLLGHAFGSL